MDLKHARESILHITLISTHQSLNPQPHLDPQHIGSCIQAIGSVTWATLNVIFLHGLLLHLACATNTSVSLQA